MASVTSLDKDLRKMRLEKYSPAAANEAKSWMESALGEPLPSGDLLDVLKDGCALCKLVNVATGPPGVKFKKSAMPFVQMENISHFLRACKAPPLSMQDHDMFLTVDLFEQKDPAQVLQCLGAFSRIAHAVNPDVFPQPIGPRLISPQPTGGVTPARNRGISNVSTGSTRFSPGKSPTNNDRPVSPNVSTWSHKNHEGITSPAWNIAQYGYMGGASQGSLGVVYGGRRQITGGGPNVPSVTEKERRRKEQEAEAVRQKQQMEEEELKRKAELEAEKERARLEEEQSWDEETRQLRAEEKLKAEEEKRRWAEEERQWKLTEEERRQEEEIAEARLAEERRRAKSQSDARLQETETGTGTGTTTVYTDRIKQLESELEQARQRERAYEEERSKRSPNKRAESRVRNQSRPPSRQDSWSRSDREVLHTQWDSHQSEAPRGRNPLVQPRPLPVVPPQAAQAAQATQFRSSPLKPQRTGEGRPLPIPGRSSRPTTPNTAPASATGVSSRPLPNRTPVASVSSPSPSASPSPPGQRSRTPTPSGRSPIPATAAATRKTPAPKTTVVAAVAAANSLVSSPPPSPPQQRKAGPGSAAAPPPGKKLDVGWSSRSLLEREMELDRQRQREWEESQAETASVAAVVAASGSPPPEVDGVGGRWDVNQWSGYTGGDSQNKGAQGIGSGRRQIVGPRPLPGRP